MTFLSSSPAVHSVFGPFVLSAIPHIDKQAMAMHTSFRTFFIVILAFTVALVLPTNRSKLGLASSIIHNTIYLSIILWEVTSLIHHK